MSTTFYKKRLENEVGGMERNSERYVPYDWYYVLAFELPKDADKATVKRFVKTLMLNDENQSCFVYVSPALDFVFSTYSSRFEESHFLEGSHQQLVSRYTWLMAILFSTSEELGVSTNEEFNVSKGVCRLIEMETRESIIAYFVHKISSFSRESMIEKLKRRKNKSRRQHPEPQNLEPQTLSSLTTTELKSELFKLGLDWEAVKDKDKYGVLYKIDREGKMVGTSQNIDFTDESHAILFD